MSTLQEHEILLETLRMSLDDIGLEDEDKEIALKTLLPIALNDETFRAKFNYTMRPESYRTRAIADNVDEVGVVESTLIPALKLPVFAFKRSTRPTIVLRAYLDKQTIGFFNTHYAEEFNIEYLNSTPHDHAASAMSRKIEYDYVLKYVWNKYCNPLLLPTNYDFSVIDVGGDWAAVLSRKQFGIHVCNPLLDQRDVTRDQRKRMNTQSDFHSSAHVCRNKFQHCSKTAPVAISVHSSYDIAPIDIVKTMAMRGISNYVGSMFLPESLASVEKFEDKNYGFNMFVDRGSSLFENTLSAFRSEAQSYRLRNKKLVLFSFIHGESREYCHEYENLILYSESHTYKLHVNRSNTEVLFDYRIIKRVGSLIYFEFVQNFEPPAANLRIARSIQNPPFDGYRVTLDSTYLCTSIFRRGSHVEILVPRGLFDTVANYCLTRITSEEFTIEQAITYTRSVMSSIQINESILSLHDNNDSFELMIACGLAAYQWSAERYKLLESRVPYRRFIERYIDSENSLKSIVDSFLNTDHIISEAKSVASRIGSSVINEVLVDNTKLHERINKLLTIINEIRSPCVAKLEDMALVVMPIDVIENSPKYRRTSDASIEHINSEHVLPTYPDYNQTVLAKSTKTTALKLRYVEAKTLIDDIVRQRFADRHPESMMPSILEISADELQNIVEDNDAEDDEEISDIDVTNIKAYDESDLNHEYHKRTIRDFVALSEAVDKENFANAERIIEKSVDENSTVPTLMSLQADQKCKPQVISAINGQAVTLTTLDDKWHLGTNSFAEKMVQYNRAKFCTKLSEDGSSDLRMIILDFDGTNFLVNSTIIKRNFDAVYVPDVQIMVSYLYKPLIRQINFQYECFVPRCITTLVNGVAGCGKTHKQVTNYADKLRNNFRPAIFSATRAAALQAKERLTERNVNYDENSILTVDAFLMHKKRWKEYTHVYIDEALQLHCGKINAIMEIAKPMELVGYGDTKQITYINFARSLEPQVETTFQWGSQEDVMSTRRISKGDRITVLSHEALYGPLFETHKPGDNIDRIAVYAETPSLEKLITIDWLYKMMNLPKSAPLLVLVYRSDIANEWRMRLDVDRRVPEAGSDKPHRLGFATIGESQGEDVENSLLLRFSSRTESLYMQPDQTIVGLTRSSKSWGYIRMKCNLTTLLENIFFETLGRKPEPIYSYHNSTP